MPDAIDLLKSRFSYKPADMLPDSGPSDADIDTLLTIASRVPDHGKLAPWRFIVFTGDARARASKLLGDIFANKNPQATPDQIAFEGKRFTLAPLVVAVVSRAAPHVKIPEWEQVLSSGAAAMNLLHAAHALGYVGGWRTDWFAYDRDAMTALGLSPHEKITGFVYVGKPAVKTESRPRPPLSDIVTKF
jgi:nitroreductase